MKLLWQADQGDNTYINPILYADYSDPDVIRVDDRYFMTASSFNCVPGLPILASYDLVNWELVNYAVKKIPFEIYNRPAHAKGIWAPSMRYHEGKYWIFFGMPDEGIFMTTATDPLGEWAPLTCVKECKGWIDPCPFWDEDGNAYLVHAFAKSRVGFNGVLDIARMSPDGTCLLDEGIRVVEADEDHRTIEGPKFYKRDGYYYIFAPAGGVPKGWQLVMRSSNIYGPYEKKIVLHQGDSDINGPHQGGLVDTPNGEEWFIHFQDADAYGRITHLQPVRWEDGWPMMGIDTNNDGIGEPVRTYKKPWTARKVEITEPVATDFFEDDILGLQWQWYANYKESFYSLTERPGYLRLYALNELGEENPNLWDVPQLLIQKLPCPELTVTTKGDFEGLKEMDKAGIVLIGKEYAYIAVKKSLDTYVLQYWVSVEVEGNKEEQLLEEVVLNSSELSLRVDIKEGALCEFLYSIDEINYQSIGKLFKAEDSTWMGVKIGLFALNTEVNKESGFVDFEYFKLEN